MSRPSHTLPAPLDAAPLPEVINHTPWPSQYFQHIDPQGEVFHVMVTRTSYSLRHFEQGEDGLLVPQLLNPAEQLPLCQADQFAGQPNASSLLQESDFAPYMPKCDVLVVNATAYAPGGKPMKRWPVGFRFGDAIHKTFEVTGPRRFGLLGLGEPEGASHVPLCYERAFGGPNLVTQGQALSAYAEQPAGSKSDNSSNSTEHARLQSQVARNLQAALPGLYAPNPIGCGRLPKELAATNLNLARLDASNLPQPQAREYEQAARQAPRPAPQIEAFGHPCTGQDDYPVVGIGPVGRWWAPRIQLAGTHDERWKQTQWPKSPLDHDYRYWNCAPEDQQIDYPAGGEDFALAGFTPQPAKDGGPVRFALPKQDLQLLVRLQVGAMVFAPMHIDTVVLDLKEGTLSIVRRATISAKALVRQLELGAWPAGTGMAPDEEMKELAKAKLQNNANTAPSAKGVPRG